VLGDGCGKRMNCTNRRSFWGQTATGTFAGMRYCRAASVL
jgi:hypothetical protein